MQTLGRKDPFQGIQMSCEHRGHLLFRFQNNKDEPGEATDQGLLQTRGTHMIVLKALGVYAWRSWGRWRSWGIYSTILVASTSASKSVLTEAICVFVVRTPACSL